MKTLLFLLLLTCSLVISGYDYSVSNKTKHNLKFEGQIYQNGLDIYCKRKILDSAFIYIYDEKNLTTDTIMTNGSGDYDFKLPLNSQYLITFSRKGFAAKKIHANTSVPFLYRGESVLEFELDLYKEIKDIDVSILDKPVADIAFDAKKKSFDYNRSYTDMVNRKLRNSYATYYKKQPKSVVIKSKW